MAKIRVMLKIAKIVGLNSDIDAALTIAATVSGSSFFALASSSVDDAFTSIRQALTEAESAFFDSHEALPQRLTEIGETLLKTLSAGEDSRVLLGAVSEDGEHCALYLLNRGPSLKAVLFREGQEIDLCSLSEGQVISGILEAGDRVVIATGSLFDFLGEDAAVLEKLPIESLEDEISLRLPEAENLPVAAVIFEKEEVVVKEAEVVEEKKASAPGRHFLGKLLPKSRRKVAILGAILLIAAISATVFSYREKRSQEISALFAKNIEVAEAKFKEAREKADAEPGEAAKSLSAAVLSLDEALKTDPDSTRAKDLKKQIEEGTGAILKIYQNPDIQLWLDLSLIKQGFKTDYLSYSRGKILVLDKESKTLASVSLANKSNQILAGEEKLGAAKLASLNGSLAWVLSDKGLVKTQTAENKTGVTVKDDEEWGNILAITGFANNIYLLDSTKSQVWKYVPVEAGYSDKQTYFAKDTKVDLSGAKQMQIDSSVWISKSGGQLLKYTQGVADYFSYSGLIKPIRDLKSFFVADDTEHVYLLDTFDKRLVVLDKKGNFKAEYQSDKFAGFSDLVVDEKGKKVYLLESSKIYSMDLK